MFDNNEHFYTDPKYSSTDPKYSQQGHIALPLVRQLMKRGDEDILKKAMLRLSPAKKWAITIVHPAPVPGGSGE